MNIGKRLTIAVAAAGAFTLSACATLPGSVGGQYPSGPTRWTQPEAQQVQRVTIATVLAIRPIEIAPGSTRTTIGSGIGAVAGGLLGHALGGGTGKTLATVAGAVGGAVVGNVATARLYRQPGLAITVKVAGGWGNGEVEQITQAVAPGVRIVPGDRVEIVGQGCAGWASTCTDPARVIPIPSGKR